MASSMPGRVTGIGLITGSTGYAITQLPIDYAQLTGWTAMAAGVGMVGGGVVTWHTSRRATTSHINRWSRRSRRNHGVQSLTGHLKTSSSFAMRGRATALRPSLARMSRWQRIRVPVTEYAAMLGKSGGRTLYASHEDVVLRVAGARSGKTTALACRIVDHPGPAVVTSTRVDLLTWTGPMRAKRGPLHVFNPAGIGDVASTLKWSPLAGCKAIETAMRRADDMIPAASSDEREGWNDQARRILAPLLFAAARGGLTMARVLAWVSATGDQATKAGRQVESILDDAPEAAAMRETVRQFFGMSGENERTRSSIVTTLMPALQWLSNPTAAAIGDAEVTGDTLNVGELLDTQGTVYLLGGTNRVTSALTGALVAEIAFRATQRAESMPGGRLDPALLLALDEAALVAPGPLDRWTSDMGGRGIVLDIAVQSLAWLHRVWGETGARIILGNAAAVLLGAGCKDPADIAHWEALSGLRDEVSETRDADGKVTSTSSRKVPVLSRDQIAALPKFHAVVYGLGPISIIRTPNIWRRRDARRAMARAGRQVTATKFAEKLAEEVSK
ncbi:TraM recognition site of TraD and TraG [Micromonospora nigra]|uniref:TraM recognition site of TraD and TraG n=1 Tax=Micromonospora nigra TaxID=145857 RepID=A0A1C6RL69_9ACTN|nr:TraM recognition domain-containing protein [Micromonospora nigra]SCL17786.1 TraM recognition site of TraD and TraG [Micromonospora nigra]